MKMTDQEHPFTPPPALVQEWIKECDKPNNPRWQEYEQDIATRAAQWGADQELGACINWIAVYQGLEHPELLIELLRDARRSKSPSLAEEALKALDYSLEYDVSSKYALLRRALEKLQELEGGND